MQADQDPNSGNGPPSQERDPGPECLVTAAVSALFTSLPFARLDVTSACAYTPPEGTTLPMMRYI